MKSTEKTYTLFPGNNMTVAEPEQLTIQSSHATIMFFPGKRVSVFLWTSLLKCRSCSYIQ